MTFRIYRASGGEGYQPCDGAYSVREESRQWYIDLNNIDDLIALNNEVGDYIIRKDYSWIPGDGWDIPHEHAIMIYDDYIE